MSLSIAPIEDADVAAIIALWQRCGLTRPWNDPAADIALARKMPNADVLAGRGDGLSGLVVAAEEELVELVRLHAPEASLITLDDYEGCGPGVASPRYLRQVLPVTRDDGTVSEAWTYVYNRPVAKLKRIASGRFLEQ